LINERKKTQKPIIPCHLYINAHEEMIDSLEIKLNRFLLLVVGLWPYQRSKLVRVQIILFFSILMSFILFQVCFCF